MQQLVADPEFIVGGANRLDVVQGSLGDCWLIAAVAALAESKPAFKLVVPEGQNFNPDHYRGMFRYVKTKSYTTMMIDKAGNTATEVACGWAGAVMKKSNSSIWA